MSGFELQETTIEEIHRAIRTGQLAVVDLVRGYLARIQAYDRSGPALNLRRFAARHEFTLAVVNMIVGNQLDALIYSTG